MPSPLARRAIQFAYGETWVDSQLTRAATVACSLTCATCFVWWRMIRGIVALNGEYQRRPINTASST